jgi:hypothetical protein
MFNGQLRDAFNREVFPNNQHPGAAGMAGGGGGCAPISSGPPAFEAASPFGNIGTSTFGNVASYQDGGGAGSGPGGGMFGNEMGPSYNMDGTRMGAGSGYGSTAGGYTAGHGGGFNVSYNGGNYAGGGYGGGGGSGAGYQTMPQQNTGVNYNECGTCDGNSPDIQYFNDPSNGAGTGYDNVGYNAVESRESHLDASHSSVNRMLVNVLKKTIVKVSKALKAKPDWVDLSPDGGASWKYSTMVGGNSLWCRVFTKVEVHGERKASKKPLPHICNITTTTKVKLDPDLVTELQKEFPMMSYCSSTNTLQITMDSLSHNLAMLSLICSAQQDKISLDNIKYYDLPKKYMLLTTPGNKRFHPAAKYSLVRQIRS